MGNFPWIYSVENQPSRLSLIPNNHSVLVPNKHFLITLYFSCNILMVMRYGETKK